MKNNEKTRENVVDTAIVLCAGKGVRMRELTADKPKCLLRLDDKSILYHILQYFHQHHIKFTAANAHHAIQTLVDGILSIDKYAELGISAVFPESKLLGTAGAIKAMEDWILERLSASQKDYFIVTHGDTLTTHDLQEFARKTAEKEVLVGMLVHEVNTQNPSSLVGTDELCQIIEFIEKPKHGEWTMIHSHPLWINAGIYCIHKDIFQYIPNNNAFVDFGHDVFPKVLETRCMWAFPIKGNYLTFDTPETYKEARKAFLEW